MKQGENRELQSDLGSLRFIDGVFYNERMKPVFAPLTNQEFRQLMTLVDEEESKKQKKLTKKEIERHIRDVERGRN